MKVLCIWENHMQQQPELDAEALVLRLRAHLAEIIRMLAKPPRAARRAQRRNKRHEAHP